MAGRFDFFLQRQCFSSCIEVNDHGWTATGHDGGIAAVGEKLLATLKFRMKREYQFFKGIATYFHSLFDVAGVNRFFNFIDSGTVELGLIVKTAVSGCGGYR